LLYPCRAIFTILWCTLRLAAILRKIYGPRHGSGSAAVQATKSSCRYAPNTTHRPIAPPSRRTTTNLLVESATKGLKRGRHCREESSPNACQQMPLLALMLSLQTVIPNLKHTKKIYKIAQFSENITYPKNWVILRV